MVAFFIAAAIADQDRLSIDSSQSAPPHLCGKTRRAVNMCEMLSALRRNAFPGNFTM
jgi:hypothetical protein